MNKSDQYWSQCIGTGPSVAPPSGRTPLGQTLTSTKDDHFFCKQNKGVRIVNWPQFLINGEDYKNNKNNNNWDTYDSLKLPVHSH